MRAEAIGKESNRTGDDPELVVEMMAGGTFGTLNGKPPHSRVRARHMYKVWLNVPQRPARIHNPLLDRNLRGGTLGF